MENMETFLVEFRDVTGKCYYNRIVSANGEVGAIEKVERMLRSDPYPEFIKLNTDTDCHYTYNIRKTSIIGYRFVYDLTAG